MKKYKSNHMVTIMFQLCNMFLITFPGVFIMWLLFNQDDQQGVLYKHHGNEKTKTSIRFTKGKETTAHHQLTTLGSKRRKMSSDFNF